MVDVEKKRGALLTIWLALMIVANAGTALYYFLFSSFITSLSSSIGLPTIPSWAIYTLGILALVNVVFAVFLIMWKKWAFFAFSVMSVVTLVINVVIGLGISSVFGLLGPVILYLLLRSKWNYLE